REGPDFAHEVEWKGADPVVAVALIAGHDEGRARSDRAEAADDEPVRALVRQKETGAIIEAVAVVIARIIAVPADDDVRVGDLLVERNAPEGALEEIVHEEKYR